MTECFICGHPILEGQKSRITTRDEWLAEGGDMGSRAHRNNADHLPTGFKTLERRYAEALGQAYLKQDVRNEERERAARLVEEFYAKMAKNEIPPDEQDERWNAGWDAAVEWIGDLAQRIREGDADDSQ